MAKNYIDISNEILASRISLVIDNDNIRVNHYVDNVDMSKGSFDSSQIADLVGIHILHTLCGILNLNQIWLYWDSGLIFIPNSNGYKTSKLRKKIIREFRIENWDFFQFQSN